MTTSFALLLALHCIWRPAMRQLTLLCSHCSSRAVLAMSRGAEQSTACHEPCHRAAHSARGKPVGSCGGGRQEGNDAAKSRMPFQSIDGNVHSPRAQRKAHCGPLAKENAPKIITIRYAVLNSALCFDHPIACNLDDLPMPMLFMLFSH